MSSASLASSSASSLSFPMSILTVTWASHPPSAVPSTSQAFPSQGYAVRPHARLVPSKDSMRTLSTSVSLIPSPSNR